MICAGIDAGSRAIKVVLLDAKSLEVVASGCTDQGIAQAQLAQALLERVLHGAGLAPHDLHASVATGYARRTVAADRTITEITCHARGVRHRSPQARTIIEIGGQDSKLVRLAADGSVCGFAMNDRCAAGTGRFLEIIAARLEVDVCELGRMAVRSSQPAAISSMCVVFAETEIIGLLAAGTPPDDIAAGVQASIAARISAMAGRELTAPVVFTGGVAAIPGMDQALQAALGQHVDVAAEPQMTGALGAALLAAQPRPG